MASRSARLRTVAYGVIRPPVAAIFILFAALGAARGGQHLIFTPALVGAFLAVVLLLVNAATVNDLADQSIDAINLPGAAARPLVNGSGDRREIGGIAVCAGASALLVGAILGTDVVLVVACGLVFSWLYSMPPVRLSYRGALAPLLLPIGYVVVPFLVGSLSVKLALNPHRLLFLAGLYACFVGRIVLKDFRDTVGDSACDKRTFLLRRGRPATLLASALCWSIGAGLLALTNTLFGLVCLAYLPLILYGLWRLAAAPSPHAEQQVIWAIARAAGGLALTLLAMIQLIGGSPVYQLLSVVAIGTPSLGLYLGGMPDAVALPRRVTRPALGRHGSRRYAGSPASAPALSDATPADVDAAVA